jgi:hypothetical protein
MTLCADSLWSVVTEIKLWNWKTENNEKWDLCDLHLALEDYLIRKTQWV